MTVAELIKQLKTFPPEAKVYATPASCCGCNRSAEVTVAEGDDQNEVMIDAWKQ